MSGFDCPVSSTGFDALVHSTGYDDLGPGTMAYPLTRGHWQGTCDVGGYPTIVSEAVYLNQMLDAGKTTGRRNRSIMSSGAAVPASISTATLSFSFVSEKYVTLENFVSVEVWLAEDGADPASSSAYRTAMAAPTIPAGCVLLATVPQASVPDAGNPWSIALDPAILSAQAGRTMAFLLATSVEAVGGGNDPTGGLSDVAWAADGTSWGLTLAFS